jgi:aspartyl-tRNA(Asn)/glutamyl-tRNA(Gln) amidotransferase subunit B
LSKAKRNIAAAKTTPENFAELLAYLHGKEINKNVAFAVLEEMEATGKDPSDIIDEKKLWTKKANIDLEKAVADAIKDNPKAVSDYNKGRTNAAQFLVGQVMKETRGAADAGEVLEMVVHKLG